MSGPALLDGLDDVPWATLDHAYGEASDVPELLRALADPDPKVRDRTMHALYGNVFHQGTRYPATPFVVPFLLELIGAPEVPGKHDLLHYVASLVSSYFSVQSRPVYHDGEHLYHWGEVVADADIPDDEREYTDPLAQTYAEAAKGIPIVLPLLSDADAAVRAQAAYVLACLPSHRDTTRGPLQARLGVEYAPGVRAAIVFALAEIGAVEAVVQAGQDEHDMVRCMATVCLARLDPSETLLPSVVALLTGEIDGYESVPGAGGTSAEDAASALQWFSPDAVRPALPELAGALQLSRGFGAMPIVIILLRFAFTQRDTPLEPPELTDLQRQVLAVLLDKEEIWSLGNLGSAFRNVGLTRNREQMATLVGIPVTTDPAAATLRRGRTFSEMRFYDKALECFAEALAEDGTVFERDLDPAGTWLAYAQALAFADRGDDALAALSRARRFDPDITRKIGPNSPLAPLHG